MHPPVSLSCINVPVLSEGRDLLWLPLKTAAIKELNTSLQPAYWGTQRRECVRKEKNIYIKEAQKSTWVWQCDPRSRGERSTGKEEEGEKNQRGKRGRAASQRGTGSISSPCIQLQQTCLTLPAPGRWRGARILMNFSKPWVSPPLSLSSLHSFSLSPAPSLHEVDYPSCPYRKRLVLWECYAWLPTTCYCSEKLPGKRR